MSLREQFQEEIKKEMGWLAIQIYNKGKNIQEEGVFKKR